MKILKKIIWLFMLAPIVYLFSIWQQLPESVALHFDINGNPDRYGSKKELWGSALLLLGVSIGVYLMITNINRIDPKRYAKEMQDKYDKMAVAIALFLSVIHFFVISSASSGRISFSPGVVFALVSALFAVMGNYMYNIKPNYFIGIRVPWTLESEDNWKKTHHLASRMWFVAGIIMAILTLLLPTTPGMIVFFAGTFLITTIPIIYSYKLFIKERNQKNQL
ncbi:SdpI family protein [Terrimonas sp. NA20]|uniref:SdpI family protein n=1 Tax=Terrimonas ginsenosidimutans TaxID=2908004 RepID=A0ABS9L086_9BACT|nr:SdpI family protein [Terrimonas ginsenosidimutans]MCG2617923.1 SdpI family protein [Terrimonas ginsenosidimutans]